MAKKAAWTDQAKADLRAIDRETALSILRGLSRFLLTEQGDVKRLQNIDPPELRLRLGDYRLRFYEHTDFIKILRVKHRRETYRD